MILGCSIKRSNQGANYCPEYAPRCAACVCVCVLYICSEGFVNIIIIIFCKYVQKIMRTICFGKRTWEWQTFSFYKFLSLLFWFFYQINEWLFYIKKNYLSFEIMDHFCSPLYDFLSKKKKTLKNIILIVISKQNLKIICKYL